MGTRIVKKKKEVNSQCQYHVIRAVTEKGKVMEAESGGFSALIILFTRVWRIQVPPRKFHTTPDTYIKYPGTKVRYGPPKNQEGRVMLDRWKRQNRKPIFTDSYHSINSPGGYSGIVMYFLHK